MTYKLFNDPSNNSTPTLVGIIRSNSNGSKTHIPLDRDNTDYQEYLEWVDAGNTPEAAD